MPADILLYALVAAGLVFWLRNILGTRHEDEPQRPNPFTSYPGDDHAKGRQRDGQAPAEPAAGMSQHDQTPEGMKEGLDKTMGFMEAAASGLVGIARADKGFSLSRFLSGAQDAFVMIVESFAEGDKETLRSLLGPSVYGAFEKAIDGRVKKGETANIEIHAIRKSEVIEASLQGKTAYITVRFVADETNVLRDKEGKVVSGNPDRVSETIDIWTFCRDTKSRSPAWVVYETRDADAEGEDHKTVPDGGTKRDLK